MTIYYRRDGQSVPRYALEVKALYDEDDFQWDGVAACEAWMRARTGVQHLSLLYVIEEVDTFCWRIGVEVGADSVSVTEDGWPETLVRDRQGDAQVWDLRCLAGLYPVQVP